MLIEVSAKNTQSNRDYAKVYIETDDINIIDTSDGSIWVNGIKFILNWKNAEEIIQRILTIKKAEHRDIKIDEILG